VIKLAVIISKDNITLDSAKKVFKKFDFLPLLKGTRLEMDFHVEEEQISVFKNICRELKRNGDIESVTWFSQAFEFEFEITSRRSKHPLIEPEREVEAYRTFVAKTYQEAYEECCKTLQPGEYCQLITDNVLF
jgi:hypothetical protein